MIPKASSALRTVHPRERWQAEALERKTWLRAAGQCSAYGDVSPRQVDLRVVLHGAKGCSGWWLAAPDDKRASEDSEAIAGRKVPNRSAGQPRL
jgi:hypothetical protein